MGNVFSTPPLQDPQSADGTQGNFSQAEASEIIRHLKGEVDRRTSEVDQLKEENRKIKKQLSELHRDKARYVETYKHWEGERHEFGRHINSLHLELEEMSSQIQALNAERNEREHNVRIAQEGAFRLARQSRVVAQDDNSVRAQLSKLERSLRSWAKKYSANSISTLPHLSEEKDKVFIELEEAFKDLDSRNLINPYEEQLGDRLPFVFVQAALSKIIFADVFGRPFFFLGEATNNKPQGVLDPSRDTSGHSLTCLYEEFQKVNREEAHVWRSKTLQLLNATGRGSGSDPSHVDALSVKGIIEARRERVYQEFTLKFLGSFGLFLSQLDIPGEVQKREESLYSLFRAAGDLSTRLWTQRTYLKCLGFAELGSFNTESPLMTAHRLQKLDDDDHRLDGKPITAIIQPAIVAFGDENGENYETWKVWAKAVVLVKE